MFYKVNLILFNKWKNLLKTYSFKKLNYFFLFLFFFIQSFYYYTCLNLFKIKIFLFKKNSTNFSILKSPLANRQWAQDQYSFSFYILKFIIKICYTFSIIKIFSKLSILLNFLNNNNVSINSLYFFFKLNNNILY